MPARAPDPCSCLAIRKAARHVTQFYDARLAASGLTTPQFSILARLRHLGPSTINDLAGDLVMDRTTLGRNLRPLERDGLLAIAADPADRRCRALVLTEAGQRRLAVARPLWQAAQAEFDARFGAEASAALRASLASLVAIDLNGPQAG
ncbi:MarR family winged helix-turn-helix transcriptional regulator [Roseicella sp. DB1501]|uniref:MarR family winged helix-turn-helix transcriptional regulator n=1 Tax=Roseicella sp. DB1501 TaxID=2730925 RepID=UPI0014919EFC|nr:MarR family winged helix-turn-helix transcriptional regulator [Roseicella sp. DB1501]NOG73284.1 winged helix-turn-helix transcriptional regulator [Roseicella sp. DB1501]